MGDRKATKQALLDAQSAGEILLVRYAGGSDPGALREILPLQVGDDHVRARCYTSNAAKTFAIAKIDIVDRPANPGDGARWNPAARIVTAPAASDEILPGERSEWILAGWHISTHDDPERGVFGVGLHRHRKRGAGHMKYPTIGLTYDRDARTSMVQPDGSIEEIVTGKRSRPWAVFGGKTTRTFGDYTKAKIAFLDLVANTLP